MHLVFKCCLRVSVLKCERWCFPPRAGAGKAGMASGCPAARRHLASAALGAGLAPRPVCSGFMKLPATWGHFWPPTGDLFSASLALIVHRSGSRWKGPLSEHLASWSPVPCCTKRPQWLIGTGLAPWTAAGGRREAQSFPGVSQVPPRAPLGLSSQRRHSPRTASLRLGVPGGGAFHI